MSRGDRIKQRVAYAIAAADHGVPGDSSRGEGLWSALSKEEQARYLMLARVAVEEYLVAVADART